MKINYFRELLLKKADGNSNLQFLIKNSADEFLSDTVLESLLKMAEDIRRPRSSNSVIKHFGEMSLDDHTSGMIHDALGHHVSHYKAAIKDGKTANNPVASKHMKKIHDIMHFSRKLSKDSIGDHSGGKLKIEAVDPKPWERQAYLSVGKTGKMSDTKGWSREHPNYEYMAGAPSNTGSYAKEIERHGHKGGYPLEEIKVNGKHLHIDDNVDASDYVEHEFSDNHPIFKPLGGSKKAAFRIPASKLEEQHYDLYDKAHEAYEDAGHQDRYDERHDALRTKDPEGYDKRGSTKPDQVHQDIKYADDKKPEDKIKGGSSEIETALQNAGIDIGNLSDDMLEKLGLKKSLLQIRDLLIKNEEFLKENPEVLATIEERLLKATDNDSDFQDEDYDEEGEPGFGDGDLTDLFDNPEEADDHYDDEDKALITDDEGKPQYIGTDEEEKTQEEKTQDVKPEEKEKTRRSGYAEWKPREDYSPEQKQKIDNLVTEGYHPGDAEVLSGAHKGHATIGHAINAKTHPHEMSDLMHEKLRDYANQHMQGVVEGEYKYADPEMNPQMATTGSAHDKHKEAFQDFSTEKQKLFDSGEYKGMNSKQQRIAFKEFRREWKKQDPDHHSKVKESWQHHGDAHKENWQKREDKVVEGMKSIVEAGQISPEGGGSISEGSQRMAQGVEGGPGGQTSQAAYQSAGSVSEGEGTTGAGSIRDPHAALAEKFPELKEKYAKKLADKLTPERATRLSRLKGAKGSGE